MSADPVPLPGTMRALRFARFETPAAALATERVPLLPETTRRVASASARRGNQPQRSGRVAKRPPSELSTTPGRRNKLEDT